MLLEKDKSDLLAKLPWSPLTSSSSAQKLQIKKLFGQDYYLVLVTDLRNVWLEHVQAADIYKRAIESDIAIVKPDSESSPALIKILATFLDHVQEIRESSDKLEIICSRQVGFARVPWSFQCEKMAAASGLNQTLLSGPDVLYKHVIGPSLALGASYHQRYTQQRQKLISMNQELIHLHEVMVKAGLGTSNSKVVPVPSDTEELKQLKETIRDEAVNANNIPRLLTASEADLMIHATESIMMYDDLGTPAYKSTDMMTSQAPIDDDLIMAAGLNNNLRIARDGTPRSPDEEKLSPKTNKAREHEKRVALRESLAQQSEKKINKRKRLL